MVAHPGNVMMLHLRRRAGNALRYTGSSGLGGCVFHKARLGVGFLKLLENICFKLEITQVSTALNLS